MSQQHFCENDLVFSYDQLVNQTNQPKEEEVLEKDDHYYFSHD